VTVVIAAGGYPEQGDQGSPIDGIEDAEATGAFVFHAGTALHGDRIVTNGGRVLDVTALGQTLEHARARAYEAAGRISFAGARYRTDIAEEAAVVG
jgi:phosphoribosylamine--glycine ligase